MCRSRGLLAAVANGSPSRPRSTERSIVLAAVLDDPAMAPTFRSMHTVSTTGNRREAAVRLKKFVAGLVVALIALTLLAGVVAMVDRVSDPASFVTWPVVAFTAVAAVVAILGVWAGLSRPALLAAGLLPALVLSYFLPAAPLPFITVVLVCFGGLAATARGVAGGLAAGTGSLMVLFVALQGPAVECGESSVTSRAPWWIESPNSSFNSGSMTADGVARGTIQVGDRRYAYMCKAGRLSSFDRVG